MLGYAAFTPEHLRLSFLLPAAAATPIIPPKPAGLDETSVTVVASERPDRRVTVCAGPDSCVSLGLAQKDPAHVSLSVAGLAVAPDADHWSTERMLENLVARYEYFGGAKLQRSEALLTEHLRKTTPSKTSCKFKVGANRRYALLPAAAPGPVSLRRMRLHVRRTRTAAESVLN